MTTEEKICNLYRGDVLAGSFYLFIGVLALLAGVLLYNMAPTLGYYYLGIGMMIFSAYMLGKGLFMIYMYRSRYEHYKKISDLSYTDLNEEKTYLDYRIEKKNKNRRRYLYTIALGMLIAFYGVFDQEKGLIIATCIPIVLMAGIEFGVGLLTEFRLFEMSRTIEKRLNNDISS